MHSFVRTRILFAAQDMGGLNALAPVMRRLARRKARYDCRVLLCDPSYARAKELGIRAVHAQNRRTALARELDRFRPQIVVTGTSSGTSLEKALIPLARARRIPTVSILDAWLNYGYQLSTRPNGRLIRAELPDALFVMDTRAKRAVSDIGFPSRRIMVTGNPAWDAYRINRPRVPKRIRMIAFIDQHFSEVVNSRTHENVGFDEKQAFGDVMEVLNDLDWKGRLLIRLHPGASSPRRYDALLRAHGRRAAFVTGGSPISTCRRADLVIGMNSAVLLEAAMNGKLAVSYQPGMSRQRDPLMSNFYGLSVPVYCRKRLRSALRPLLGAHPHLPRRRAIVRPARLDGRATDRVVESIESLVSGISKPS